MMPAPTTLGQRQDLVEQAEEVGGVVAEEVLLTPLVSFGTFMSYARLLYSHLYLPDFQSCTYSIVGGGLCSHYCLC